MRDGYLNQRNGLPVIDLDILRKYCGDETDGFDNIILTTGGMDGLLFSIISNQDSSVFTLMKNFIDIFERKNIYIEVQFHGFVKEQQCFPKMATLAETIGVGLLATNDPRFVTCSEDEITAYQIIKYANTKRIETITDADKEYYIKTPKKLREALSCILFEDQVDRAIDSIKALTDACDLQFSDTLHYPKFKSVDSRPSAEVLRDTVHKSIPNRYTQWTEQHETRLRHELDIIISMGFADYMLVVADYVGYAKSAGKRRFQNDHAVVVGPGRGSAVGSLVCYLLGITDVDPICHGLLFERFLNPARTAMPDIDVDFAKCIKDDVIDYVRGKYGNSSVGKLSVNVLFSLKESIIITAKYLSKLNNDQDYIFIGNKMVDYLKLIDKDNNVSMVEHENKLLSIAQEMNKEKGTRIINSATLVANIISHKSVHSAGVIISDTDLSDCVPIKMDENGGIIAECDKDEVESFYRMIKMDFLTNKSLDHISYVIGSLMLREKKSIEFGMIPLDNEVFENIINKGHTDYIFQLSNRDMKILLQRLCPHSMNDLMHIISIYRPGPKQYIDSIYKIINGEEEPKYLVPQLEPILQETYGCIVYQEQVMRIFTDLAGYSMEEADVVRAAISKKKRVLIEKEHDKFVFGCTNNGIDKDKANDLYAQIVDFAEYSFNKSHAVAYTLIAYRMAWLYYHYPQYVLCYAPFFFDNEIFIFFEECIRNRIKIVSPNLNKSKNKNRVIKEGILLGYSMISGIGSFGEVIERNRSEQGVFVDLTDFILRLNPADFVIKSLALSGAFDCLGIDRQSVADNSLEIIRISKKIKCLSESTQNTQDDYERNRIEHEISEYKSHITKLSIGTKNSDIAARIKIEVEVFGFPVSLGGEWLDSARNNQVKTSICNLTLGYHTLCGVVYNVDILKTLGKKEEYAKIKIYDGTGFIECTVSSRYYPHLKDNIIKGGTASVTGNYTYDKDRDQYAFWVNDIS